MAMTQLILVFFGSVALACSAAMFLNLDRGTALLVPFVAALFWGATGMGAFDVIVVDSYAATRSEPILPLAYIGLGLAIACTLYGIYAIIHTPAQEAEEADMMEGLR